MNGERNTTGLTAQLHLRPERPADAPAVHRVNELAFEQPAEADLVEALHAAGAAAISLVALVNDEIVGHILFSPVTVRSDEQTWPALALGPMAVLPEHQRQGIGTALVRAGLDACRDLGETVVFVLGHPEYYPRFGFTPAPPRGLTCRWPVPDEVFMVAELENGALAGRVGRVEYHPAFDQA
jgi:putative acetyltransferase